jgi:hypothetical protein
MRFPLMHLKPTAWAASLAVGRDARNSHRSMRWSGPLLALSLTITVMTLAGPSGGPRKSEVVDAGFEPVAGEDVSGSFRR